MTKYGSRLFCDMTQFRQHDNTHTMEEIMKQISFQVPDVTIQQIRDLARKWGEPKQRHNTPVVARCVERMWQIECSGRQQYGNDVQAGGEQ